MALLDGVARWRCPMARLDGSVRWLCSMALFDGSVRWRCSMTFGGSVRFGNALSAYATSAFCYICVSRPRRPWRFASLATSDFGGYGVSLLWRSDTLVFRDFGVLTLWRFAASRFAFVSFSRFATFAFRDWEEGACGDDVPTLPSVATPTAVLAVAVDGRRECCSGP